MLVYPTALHAEVAELVTGFFSTKPEARAVVVLASCARGKATPESDLDMAVLVRHGADCSGLEDEWSAFREQSEPIRALDNAGMAATLHLDLIDGVYTHSSWDDGGGPDGFELEIGNHLAHSAPIWEKDRTLDELKDAWLPFYDDDLRSERLGMVLEASRRDLDFVPFYVGRELYFQAFDRLYKSYRQFLQALFISRRIYPVSYTKWIREQICDLLDAPDLYGELPGILEVGKLESDDLVVNADRLRKLIDGWIRP